MKTVAITARLLNDHRSLDVPSGDWESILIRFGQQVPASSDRWSEAEGTWRWTAQEAEALADKLTEDGGRQCVGRTMLDLKLDDIASGTRTTFAIDGRTPEERTALKKLAQR